MRLDVRLDVSLGMSLGHQQFLLNQSAETQTSSDAMTPIDAGTLTSFSFQGPDAAAQAVTRS